MNAATIIQKQRAHFTEGNTYSLTYRIRMLSQLHAAITEYQQSLLAALHSDLGKGDVDAYTTEVGYVLSEIEYARKHVYSWMKKSTGKTVLLNRPGRSYFHSRPLGCALIIGPWNYPFALTFAPLAAALAAGNCVILKPSEYAPATESCIVELIERSFEVKELAVFTGGAKKTTEIIMCGVDIIFFTGGTQTGKNIMREASDSLTPVVLELGGKNPCIVDQTAYVPEAARRITWGKFLNAGQTCMAPDFVCVHERIADSLRSHIINAIRTFYGVNPIKSTVYGRIINRQHMHRVAALLDGHTIIHGGTIMYEDQYIAPTLVHVDTWDAPLMCEEVFGPVLPIITFQDAEQLLDILCKRPSPLAWYCFSTDNAFKRIVEKRGRCGTICFNGTIHALITHDLPFGGIGHSGMGRYHGKAGFDAFSYTCSIVDKHPRKGFSALYPPYTISVKMLSKLRRFLM